MAAVHSIEAHGFLAFGCMVFMLFHFGRIFVAHVADLPLGYQLMLLAFGGYVAYRAWPQYEKQGRTSAPPR
ncbi:MAG TPA: hypothetical protein PKY96_08010 [Flavobacteriales bacterium]|nr:hypothetical protein [Flavobacteriales bacterium]